MKINEILLLEDTTTYHKLKVTLSNKEKVTLTMIGKSSGGKNNWRNLGYDITMYNSKSFPRKETDGIPKGPEARIGYRLPNDRDSFLTAIAERISKVEVDLPDRKNFDKEFQKITSEEIHKEETSIINAQKTFSSWTDKDWDELWNNPTPQKVFEWEHGKPRAHYNSPSSSITLKQITVTDGRVNYNRYPFVWIADRDHMPFKLGELTDRVEIRGEYKLKCTTDWFPTKCNRFEIKDAEFVDTIDKLPETTSIDFKDCSIKKLDVEDQGDDDLHFGVAGCKSIRSLDGVPRRMSTLNISYTGIDDLHDVHKKIDHLWMLYCGDTVKKNILGLLLIDGFKESNAYSKPSQAFAILKKYVGQGKQGVMKAQRELLDNDLDDFAEL